MKEEVDLNVRGNFLRLEDLCCTENERDERSKMSVLPES